MVVSPTSDPHLINNFIVNKPSLIDLKLSVPEWTHTYNKYPSVKNKSTQSNLASCQIKEYPDFFIAYYNIQSLSD